MSLLTEKELNNALDFIDAACMDGGRSTADQIVMKKIKTHIAAQRKLIEAADELAICVLDPFAGSSMTTKLEAEQQLAKKFQALRGETD